MRDPELIDAWLTWLEHNKGRSVRTVDKYRKYLLRLRQALGTPLLKATRDQLETWVGLELHRAGMLPRSRKVAVAAVRGFFAWAADRGHIDSSPAATLEYPKAGRSLPRPAGIEHAEKLLMQPDLDTFLGVRDAAILAVLIGCGPRRSGVVALNERDLVWTNLTGIHERLVIRFTEKGKHERLVPAPLETALFLRAYLGHPDLETIDRSLPNGDQVLFVSTANRGVAPQDYHGEARRLSMRGLDDMIRTYSRRAGIPDHLAHAHAYRHLYGTELAEHDVGLDSRRVLLGHVKADTTADYTHLAMRKMAEIVDRANPMGRIRSRVSPLAARIRNA